MDKKITSKRVALISMPSQNKALSVVDVNTACGGQLSKTGHITSVRFSFAFFGVNERFRDLRQPT